MGPFVFQTSIGRHERSQPCKLRMLLFLIVFGCLGGATGLQAEEGRTARQARDDSYRSPYGVCAHVSRGEERPIARQEFSLMNQAGIVWVRTDFDWSGVERAPGKWTFDHLDQVVAWAEEAGICLLPILDYDVPWARPAYKHLDKWLEYVRRTVGRYKDRLRYWEVWNEPNLEGFWRDKPSAENYVTLLRATYQEIKRIDPDLVVLLGGMAGIPWDYLEGIYRAGGRDFFDIMNVHPYRYPRTPEESRLEADILRLRELMSRHADREKPIWITEIGWPTHVGPRGVEPEVQAWMLARSFLLSLDAGVAKIFWYEFQAPEGKADYNEDHFGIVHRDLKPKPAYHAYRILTQVRPVGSVSVGGWQQGEVICRAWDQPGGVRVWAMWTIKAPQDVTIEVRGAIQDAFTWSGERTDFQAQEGRLRIKAGPGPVYILGPEMLRFVEE